MLTKTVLYPRTVKSYVCRTGRITARQKGALQKYWPEYGLEVQDGLINFNQIYGRNAPTVLEVGFGMGDALLEMAHLNPDTNYLGIEVHKPGVGRLLDDIAAQGLCNIRVYCADALEVLTKCISDATLDSILLFFPDPWPKKRHHKRRIIQVGMIEMLWSKLKVNGVVHVATDVEDYANYILRMFTNSRGFINQNGQGNFAPCRPDNRPQTKYEQRGSKCGHSIWDMLFIKDSK